MSVIIWHNPRCTKSRQTLALLEERGITPKVRLYLEDAPSAAEIKVVLKKLGRPASALVRPKEAREEGVPLEKGEDALIEGLAAHPRAIERPLVIHGDKAAIGRPPEAVLEIV